jgi:hypothetical protein
MKDTLHVPISEGPGVIFRPGSAGRPVDVRESVTAWVLDPEGKLETNTVLSGRLFFTADRVYGLFTEAKTKDGKSYPVCLELTEARTKWTERGGVAREDVGGPADAAVIYPVKYVRAVRRFPNPDARP